MSTQGSEWQENTSSHAPQVTAKSATPTTFPKLPLAAHRYGREEMLLFFSPDTPFPSEMADIPILVRKQVTTPLALCALSPEEQVVLSGSVNSTTGGYSSRGRGGYSRGRGGRGRAGRPDYYHRTSSGEEFKERGTYYRSNSESDKGDEKHVGATGGYADRVSRASQDTNWRSVPKEVSNVWVGKSWSTSSPVKSQGGGAWEQGGAGGKKHWQPLPDWAAADTSSAPATAAESAKDQDDQKLSEPPDDNQEKEEDTADLNEDVFVPFGETPKPMSVAVETAVPQPVKSSRIASADSVEEMERRFEKAAEALISTDDDTPVQSPSNQLSSTLLPPASSKPSNSTHLPSPVATVAGMDMNQWLYQDPQGDTQGPFSSQEMNNWFSAGYFTMSLHVRRVCDAFMLPLGQVIRIWGRTPFIPGAQPPPLQNTEPFWQQMFQQQHQLFPTFPSSSTAPPPPQEKLEVSLNASEPSPIWGVVAKETVATEDQWPDLGARHHPVTQLSSHHHQQQQQEGEERRQRLKEEEAARLQSAELQRQREEKEEERRRKFEEDQRRLREEEERRKREEEKRQFEIAERQRLDEERREEQRRRKEEERKRKEIERRQQIEEERRLREEKEKLQREKIEHDLYQRLQLEEQRSKTAEYQHQEETTPTLPHPPPPPAVPSLLDIQREEAARELARHQEIQSYLQQQQQFEQQQQMQQQTKGWSNVTTPTTKSSFLEIQQEQEQQGTIGGQGQTVGGRGQTVASKSATVGTAPTFTSWSKITAGNRPPNPSWGANHVSQTMPANPRPPQTTPLKETQPLSFWEECALDSVKRTTTRGRGRERQGSGSGNKPVGGGASNWATKEEEKVRQLFNASTPDEEFTEWCGNELVKYSSDVDAATFVNLLLDVESIYEVHDYIKSFLGESDEVHAFAKQFLERRQKIRNYNVSSQSKKTSGGGASSGRTADTSSSSGMGGASSSTSRNSKKKKKGGGGGGAKMQRIPPSSLLGFTVNAAERPNAGEIQSAKDAM